MKIYYVYILASSRNGTLYIGFTDDLERRVAEHKSKNVEGFTSKYNVALLVYYETYASLYDAFRRERQLKKWKRDWKIELIEKNNLDWDDLAEGWQ